MNSDILLLQEVDKIEDFKQYLSNNGYYVSFRKRPNGKCDGCLTAWKRDLFDLISPIYITDYNYLIHNQQNKHTEMVFTKDNLAMIVVLKSKQNNTNFIVAQTHLHWNPNLDHVKLWQTSSFLNSVQFVINKYFNNNDNYKLIIGGDFNSTPNSNVYKFIVNGYIDTKQIAFTNNMNDKEKKEEEIKSIENKLSVENGKNHEINGNNLKFIVDSGRNTWLQWLGIDATTFPSNTASKEYQKLFNIARKENRIILTQNSKLTSKANCPKYLLLDHNLTGRQCFDLIINHFNIDIKDYHNTIKDKVYCPSCNIQMDIKNDDWQWFNCSKCNFAQFDAVKHFYDHCENLIKLRNNMDQKNNDNDECKQILSNKMDIKNLKVMLDFANRSECIALRWIGIDATFIPYKHAVDHHQEIFDTANKENRIIITSNKSLPLLTGCPEYVLIDNKTTSNYRSKIINVMINQFGIKFDHKLKDKYMKNIADNLLCAKCVEPVILKKIKLREVDKSKISRKVLKQLKQKYNRDYILEFWQCTRCQYLPYLNTDDLFEQLYMRLGYKFEEKVERVKKKEVMIKEDDGFEVIPYNEEVFPLLNAVELRHSLGKLKSVYCKIYGKEPETTNHRKEFSGCLDYIFVCQKTNVVETDKILEANQLEFIPNKRHGSDHLPLKTTIN